MANLDTAPVKAEPGVYAASRTPHHLRRAAQVTVFVLFLGLLIGTRPEVKTGLPQNLFFRLDPLAGTTAMLASRSWLAPLAIGSILLLVVGLVFGRAWCAWACPLGTLLDWLPSRRASLSQPDPRPFWRQGKNLALAAVILGALLGSLTLVVLDPVTLIVRSFTAVVLPLLDAVLAVVTGALSLIFSGVPSIHDGLAWFDTNIRASLLGGGFYLPNLTLLLLFAGVLALNAVRPRAWCRYLCPLGALYGLLARVSLVRRRVDAARCIACGSCAAVCPTGAIHPERRYAASSAECITCLECQARCERRAISFPFQVGLNPAYQPERREFLAVLGLAVVGAAALRFTPSPNQAAPSFIRPPGATESSLAGRCIRCGECARVCPTAAIQPVTAARAWDSTWSPHLALRHGYCDYACNACGQVCPTGAIPRLSLSDKQQQVLGVAAIDEERCIVFNGGRKCQACEQACPLPQKAIVLKRENGLDRPYVDESLCNGCGLCEHECPVAGRAAIRVACAESAHL